MVSFSSEDAEWSSIHSQDDDEAWSLVHQNHFQEVHHSDQFGLKKGRCHTCLSLLEDGENHTLPPTNCLDDVGVNLDAPRCSACLEVAEIFDHFKKSAHSPDEAKAIFPKLKRLVKLTHRRKEENEDKILKAIEDDFDQELKGLQKMLEKCRLKEAEGSAESSQRGHAGATDVALGLFTMKRERSRTTVASLHWDHQRDDEGVSDR